MHRPIEEKWEERLLRRLRAAFRTNKPQAMALVAVTAMNLMACGLREHETPWWLWVGAGLFCPAFVFINNLIDPIPADNDRSAQQYERR